MDLREFVSTALIQIINGVTDAQKGTAKNSINPQIGNLGHIEKLGMVGFSGIQMVKFDVAVSSSEGTATEGKAGLFVAPFFLGTQGKSDASSNSISRIQFGVPVALPLKDEGAPQT